nr:DUF2971 domain-containing protein [Rhodanobacter glycinis]
MTGSPNRIFKYLAPERISVLSEQLIRYTPLGAFNDPFEGRPEIRGFVSDEEALSNFATAVPSELSAAYSKLPTEVRKIVSHQQWMQFATPFMVQHQSEFLAMLHTASTQVLPSLPSKFDDVMGVLSLCEVPDSLLMWAHYGVSHTGFVIEFDPSHPYFNTRRSEDDEFGHLRQVVYRDIRPSANLIDLDGSEMFLVKSKEWEYEHEWRVLRPLKDAEQVISVNDQQIHLFQLPQAAVKAVIFGSRASAYLMDQARELISANSEISHIQMLRCVPSESRFALDIRPYAT